MEQPMDDIRITEAVTSTVEDNVMPAHDRDTLDLAKVGKKQVLKRRFGLLSMIGFACSTAITWEGLLTDFVLGLDNGGPAGLIYGYLIAWAGALSVYSVIGELSSMFPTAGGHYHWVSLLAPRRARSFLSYITGWANVISILAASTAVAFFTGTMLQALVALRITTYDPTGWQGTLMMWAVILLATLVTTTFGRVLPAVEVLFLLLHVLGFFGTMVPLAYYAGSRGHVRQRTQEIFTSFYNFGGWGTQTLSFFIGLQGNAVAFIGSDGPVHMSEEVERSTVNVARSMLYSILLNGAFGFAILLCLLFAADDLQVVAQTQSTYVFIDILSNILDDFGGTATIVTVVILMNMASTMGALATSGRMVWSFSRDRGLPGWQWTRKVEKRTSIPHNAIYVTAAIAALLGLINIGSIAAFEDVVSLSLVGFYMVFLSTISQLLYRRLRGDVAERDEDVDQFYGEHDSSMSDSKPFTWGPWRLPGWLGILNNIFAVVFLLTVGFFAFWPLSAKVTALNMDYASVVLVAVYVGSMVWYFVRGRTEYSGPVIEVHVEGRGALPPKM